MVQPRKAKRGVYLISGALPFGSSNKSGHAELKGLQGLRAAGGGSLEGLTDVDGSGVVIGLT